MGISLSEESGSEEALIEESTIRFFSFSFFSVCRKRFSDYQWFPRRIALMLRFGIRVGNSLGYKIHSLTLP